MLADQATYCLSGSHALCPRYQRARLSHGFAPAGAGFGGHASGAAFALYPTVSLPLESDLLSGDVDQADEAHALDFEDEEEDASRHGVWIAALAVFALIFLCGIASSTYAGWQIVRGNSFAEWLEPNRALSNDAEGSMAVTAPTATIAAVVVVVTATPEPAAQSGVAPADAPQSASNAPAAPPTAFDFPSAVTPTPPPANSNPAVGAPENATSNEAQAPVVAQAPAVDVDGNGVVLPPTTLPDIDVNAIVPLPPTRRPTPEFAIPTSTPVTEDPTETPTPTATWPPPMVIFGPDEPVIEAGDCTIVRWEVENVRAVYYENQQAMGSGEREECLDEDENDGETYALTVVLPSGATEIYTTTVMIIPPTPTPTPSWTYTPVPDPTATWTPIPPTATPTPDHVYGTTLSVNGGQTNHACTIGQTCEIGLLATNTGNIVDTIAIVVVQSGPWSPLICRQDGVCSDQRLELTNVGPSLTAYITLRLEIPADASQQTATYAFRSLSVESGDVVGSEVLSLNIEAK